MISKMINVSTHLESKYSPRFMAIIYVIISTFCYATISLLTKLCHEIPPFQLIYHRAAIETSLCFFSLIYTKGRIFSKDEKTNRLLLMRGMLGGCGMILYFHSLYFLPIAICTVIFMMTPLWVGIFNLINDKELRFWNFLFMILSFGGMLFIIKPGFSKEIKTDNTLEYYIGISMAMTASFFAGAVYYAIKNLKGKAQIAVIVIYFNFFNIFFAGLGQIFTGIINLNLSEYFILFIIGVIGWLAQILKSKALILENVFFISVLLYIQIIFSYLADVFVLGIQIDLYSNLGCVIIAVSMIGLIYSQKKNS